MNNVFDLEEKLKKNIDKFEKDIRNISKKITDDTSALAKINEKIEYKSACFYIDSYLKVGEQYDVKTISILRNIYHDCDSHDELIIKLIKVNKKSISYKIVGEGIVRNMENNRVFELLGYDIKEAINIYKIHVNRNKSLDRLLN